MKITVKFRPNKRKKIDVPEKHLFLGDCLGVALVPRGKDDNHICMLILTEDDEEWSTISTDFSSDWFSDLTTQIKRAKKWMKNNAVKEKDSSGYRFK